MRVCFDFYADSRGAWGGRQAGFLRFTVSAVHWSGRRTYRLGESVLKPGRSRAPGIGRMNM